MMKSSGRTSGVPHGANVLFPKDAGTRVPWDEELRLLDVKSIPATVEEIPIEDTLVLVPPAHADPTIVRRRQLAFGMAQAALGAVDAYWCTRDALKRLQANGVELNGCVVYAFGKASRWPVQHWMRCGYERHRTYV